MLNEQLKGKWTLVSWTRKAVDDGTISHPFGQFPKGHIALDGSQIMVVAHKDVESMSQVQTIQHDTLSNQSVTEFSYMGRYSLENDLMTITYEECSDQSKIGQVKKANIWFDGQVTLCFTAHEPITIDGRQYIPAATFIKNS